jgi:hypothetical protein
VLAVGVAAFAPLQSLVVPVLTTVQQEMQTSQDAATWVLTRYLASRTVRLADARAPTQLASHHRGQSRAVPGQLSLWEATGNR